MIYGIKYGVEVCHFVNRRRVPANNMRLKLPQHQMYKHKIKFENPFCNGSSDSIFIHIVMYILVKHIEKDLNWRSLSPEKHPVMTF